MSLSLQTNPGALAAFYIKEGKLADSDDYRVVQKLSLEMTGSELLEFQARLGLNWTVVGYEGFAPVMVAFSNNTGEEIFISATGFFDRKTIAFYTLQRISWLPAEYNILHRVCGWLDQAGLSHKLPDPSEDSIVLLGARHFRVNDRTQFEILLVRMGRHVDIPKVDKYPILVRESLEHYTDIGVCNIQDILSAAMFLNK